MSQNNAIKQDRFLVAIVAAVGLLVITALVLFFIRQDERGYGAGDTPESVVRNYIIALHDEDFQKAHGYLLDSPQKPDYQEFLQPFLAGRLDLSNITVRTTETFISDDEASVKLILTHGSSNPFEGSRHEEGSASLVLQQGSWKLDEMPYPYWGWDWYPQPQP